MTPRSIPLKPTVCLILSGPSWLEVDEARLRQANATFIAVNVTGPLLPWTDYWFTVDSNQVRLNGPVVTQKRIVGARPSNPPANADYWIPTTSWTDDWNPDTLRGYNTGMAAHEMCLKHPAVERVFLFGCDLRLDWQAWHDVSIRRPQAHHKAYGEPLLPMWSSLPLTPPSFVVAPESRLTRFPRISWAEAEARLLDDPTRP